MAIIMQLRRNESSSGPSERSVTVLSSAIPPAGKRWGGNEAIPATGQDGLELDSGATAGS